MILIIGLVSIMALIVIVAGLGPKQDYEKLPEGRNFDGSLK